MANTPLPKPAPPKPTTSQGGQIPAGQTVSVQPPSPTKTGQDAPGGSAPSATGSNPVAPNQSSAPNQGSATANVARSAGPSPQSSGQQEGGANNAVPQPPAQPKVGKPIPVLEEKSSSGGSVAASGSVDVPPQTPPVMPGSPPQSQTKPTEPAQQPPKTLNALQSMSSNKLPELPPDQAAGNQGSAAKAPQPGQSGNQANSGKDDQGAKKGQQPEVAKPKKSILRFLPIILGVVLIVAAAGFAAYWFLLGGGSSSSGFRGSSGSSSNSGSSSSAGTNGQSATGSTPEELPEVSDNITLEYWGLWEPNEAMESVIDDYEQNNPGIKINYKKQSYQDYRERLQNAVVSGNGPDIFRYHATWVPMLEQELAPLPSAVMTSSEFSSTFYPVAAKQLNVDGQIVGIPLMYEGLGLYYNTEIFATAVEDPPTTWSELRTVAKKLTVKADNGTTRAGIALGNATNVEHFSDILAVLMLQNGADMTQPNSPQTRDALLFYTNFITQDKVWDSTLPSSTIAFAQGDAAMMIAPSWRAHEVKAQNPNLQFAVVPIPQLSDTRIGWASYWAEGVSEQSENKQEAWQFVKYLSSRSVQEQLHSDQSQLRSFGELYSRVDLANELANDPVMSAYLQDAPYAEGWYMSSYTHDDGINDNIIKYYEDAVTSLTQGGSIDGVLETLDQGVRQELRQYGVDEE